MKAKRKGTKMKKKGETQGPKPKPSPNDQIQVKPHATRESGAKCRRKKEMLEHLLSLQNPLNSPSFSASPLLIIFGQPS